jgi:hypothetical protein
MSPVVDAIFVAFEGSAYHFWTKDVLKEPLPSDITPYEYCLGDKPWDRVFHVLFANTEFRLSIMLARSRAMPSPFPGMNPYLEHPDVWHDFHSRFIVAAADALTAQVRPNYIVKIDSQIYLHDLLDEPRKLLGRGDANILRVGEGPEASPMPVAMVEAPVTGRIELAEDEERLSYLEIVDREERDVVAVLELLSPTNKLPGPNREQYLAKRRHLLRSEAHLVEIDLLRAGPRMPVEKPPACDYLVLVSQAENRPAVQLWPLMQRDPLPTIPVPLRGQQEARLDLQAALHRVYDSAGYSDYIYKKTPEPPLRPDDAQWAATYVNNR